MYSFLILNRKEPIKKKKKTKKKQSHLLKEPAHTIINQSFESMSCFGSRKTKK